MLTELVVRDLGVIEEATVVFGPGLTALTGESGAGKTLLVEAVGLLLGERADATLVRAGAGEAVVQGRFEIRGTDGDDEMVLTRVVPAAGRSRAYISGRLVTATELVEHGRALVDLHGQNGHQGLLSMAAQRAALDRYARIDLQPLVAARAQRRAVEDALEAMGGDARARAREVDLLRFQVDELERAALDDAAEDEALALEEDALAGVQAHREAGEAALAALGEDGARDTIGVAVTALTGRAPFRAAHDRVRALAADLDDAVDELRRQVDALDEDPARLEQIGARRHLLHDLRRKYGETLADVIAYREEARARLMELTGHDERLQALEAERGAAVEAEQVAAAAVGRARRAAAPELAEAVQANLVELALPKAEVAVDVSEDPEGAEVRFLLAANDGEPLLALSRVASGGELARVMLALRLVLTEAPDTLLFDEVDAGIGGEAALAVGQALSRLTHEREDGRVHQVLVVTHLAQVAACAERQLVVGKSSRGGRTAAAVEGVTGEARVIELARMLSGLSSSGTARRHTLELLERAAERQ